MCRGDNSHEEIAGDCIRRTSKRSANIFGTSDKDFGRQDLE